MKGRQRAPRLAASLEVKTKTSVGPLPETKSRGVRELTEVGLLDFFVAETVDRQHVVSVVDQNGTRDGGYQQQQNGGTRPPRWHLHGHDCEQGLGIVWRGDRIVVAAVRTAGQQQQVGVSPLENPRRRTWRIGGV